MRGLEGGFKVIPTLALLLFASLGSGLLYSFTNRLYLRDLRQENIFSYPSKQSHLYLKCYVGLKYLPQLKQVALSI